VGFVCDINGKKSNQTLKKGLEVLRRLAHRGAVGADPKTGDGAGILIQIPHQFLLRECRAAGICLPEPGSYGVGLVFLPTQKTDQKFCIDVFEKTIKQEGGVVLGWRDVPLNNSIIGRTARETEPVIRQLFIGKRKKNLGQLAFERKLLVIRREVENTIRRSDIKQGKVFYITNLSSKTLSYKGLLMPEQLGEYFLDLKDPSLTSAICLVHSRYSTNTFPTWDLAQPFRFLAHNGEINTLRGNINWMRARESLLKSRLLGNDIQKLKPVIVPEGSDSATIDNVFELLVLAGRPLAHAIMMLIPEAWNHNDLMDQKLKSFYQYHACFMEPWDGPAAIAFTDGISVGAVLDRNGLRPARYIVTKDGLAVMASEVGVLDIPASRIAISGRLEPGKIFLIDTQRKKIIEDKDLKREISSRGNYGSWIKKNLLNLKDLPGQAPKHKPEREILTDLKAFGYTREDLKFIIRPMAETGKEPIGSMGNDTPHAVLSRKPQLLYNYFKQLFAQVTNPAIDPIREKLVMSLESYIGSQRNILDQTPGHCHKLRLEKPLLTNQELAKISKIKKNGFKTKRISILFKASDKLDFLNTLERICEEAESAIEKNYPFIILSDRGVNEECASLPALLASGAVHQHLVERAIRTRVAIIIESAEPREVNHFALLFAYGGDCVNPYLAYKTVDYLIDQGQLKLDRKTALANYRKSIHDGILKILSKMGISTLQSYRGAQIYEAVGLNEEIIERCFKGTASRIGGVELDTVFKETLLRHQEAFRKKEDRETDYLTTGGQYQWKRDGEYHLWNPESIIALQQAVRTGDYEEYRKFAEMINQQEKNPTTLRSLLDFNWGKPIPIEEVESAQDILKRFATGAMSYGSISRQTHETIAIAMNRIGGRSNSGEGGEDPERFKTLPSGDSKRSAVKQVASGRFGVACNYLVNADELQIKIAQGAKPGEGGQLPGHKVSVTIAKTRYTTPGVTLISPPPHHDIYSIEDLAQLIFDLKNANPAARVSVKLVSEVGVGTIAAGVTKGHADMILISGGDGGTGASPLSSIKHAGLPWELGLSETHQTLVLNNLRSRVRLQTDGQMRTGRDVAIACMLGAEEFGFCTAVLITLGCVMLRHCHLNNCSVGIATQDELLCRKFTGKPELVVNYFHFITRELRQIMSNLGIRTIDELVGRTDLLKVNREILPWKAKEIDFSKILYRPKVPESVKTHCLVKQNHGIDRILDLKLIAYAQKSLRTREPVKIELPIMNSDRATGAMLSGELCRAYGEKGLADETIHCKFSGTAGQSFGAFLAKGITFELEGMSNDYIGKGICGGMIIVYPAEESSYKPEENIIIGNTTFYGATSGEAYIRGRAGERFCIRNSGLRAVVEGIGDHGCEYMTGGRVVVIGDTGRNFAAGMSGGIAYVYASLSKFRSRCNSDMVELQIPGAEDYKIIKGLLSKHYRYTRSKVARDILKNYPTRRKRFIKVMSLEYKRVLEGKPVKIKPDLSEVSDG